MSLTIDLEKTQRDALEAIASERGDSVASLVRKAVAGFLTRQKRK